MSTEAIVTFEDVKEKKTPWWQKLAVILAMMTVVGGSLTGLMTYMNLGFTDTFFASWMSSFFMALFTVMPAGLILMLSVTVIVTKLTPNMGEKKRNLIVGIGMAIAMESIMAFSTAWNNIGFHDMSAFYSAWSRSLLAALPMALVLSTIISTTIKPKIERLLRS